MGRVANVAEVRAAEARGRFLLVSSRGSTGYRARLGIDMVVRAAPDGYPIGYGNIGGLAINRSMMKVPYDALTEMTAGRGHVVFESMSSIIQHHRAGGCAALR